MKTKYWPSFVIGGWWIIYMGFYSVPSFLLVILGIISLGYGFKLKRLKKKGIEDTKKKKSFKK